MNEQPQSNDYTGVSGVGRMREALDDLIAGHMQEGVHYGRVPGIPKPFLQQPGAEVICLCFGWTPHYTVTAEAGNDGHRIYEASCELRDRAGRVVCQGVGACSTHEGQYQRGTPGDHYNTCKKIARKRAQVDAAKAATASSDRWSQDEDYVRGANKSSRSAPDSSRKATPKPPPQPAAGAKATPAPKPKPADTPGRLVGTFTIAEAKLAQEGQGQKGHWKRYEIIAESGDLFDTFSESLYNVAQQYLEAGTPVLIEYTVNKFGNRIDSIVAAPPAEAPPAPQVAGSAHDYSNDQVTMKCKIKSVEAKRARKPDGKVGMVYAVETSQGRYGTWDEKMAANIKNAGGRGVMVTLYWRDDPKGKLVTHFEEVPF